MRKARVVVLGLDGVGFDITEQFGLSMPNLEALRQNGLSGDLISTVPPITPPAWTTMVTGRNPGEHGLLNFALREETSYRVQSLNASHRASKPIWTELSEAGKRVGVFNVPMTYPLQLVNGFMIAGLGAPSPDAEVVWPLELRQELDQQGLAGYQPDFPRAIVSEDCSAYLQELAEILEARVTLLKHLWKREPWDFFMAVLMAPDHVHHVTLSILDAECPDHDPVLADKYLKLLQRIYSTIDELIGWFRERLDDDTYLLIASDHGATSLISAFYLNQWLEKLGFLAFHKGKAQVGWRTPLYELLREKVPNALLKFLVQRGGLEKLRRNMRDSMFVDRIDWSQTSAYSVGGSFGGFGQIHLKVKGREPQGIVMPGVEYEQIRATLIEQLEALVDPETGEPVVAQIFQREEIFEGPFAERAPDIVFLTAGMKYCVYDKIDFNARVPLDKLPRNAYGGHAMAGIVLVEGAGIVRGQDKELSIYDIHPIILYVQDQPVDIESVSMLQDVFEPSHLAAKPPAVRTRKNSFLEQQVVPYTQAEEESLKGRLRVLGYL